MRLKLSPLRVGTWKPLPESKLYWRGATASNRGCSYSTANLSAKNFSIGGNFSWCLAVCPGNNAILLGHMGRIDARCIFRPSSLKIAGDPPLLPNDGNCQRAPNAWTWTSRGATKTSGDDSEIVPTVPFPEGPGTLGLRCDIRIMEACARTAASSILP